MNIGTAIKVTAVVFILIMIIVFAVIGGGFGEEYILLGALVGLIVGWLQFILLYGFGELINDVHHIRQKTCGDVVPAPKASQPAREIPRLWDCPLCHEKNPVGRNVCVHCGTRLDHSAGNAPAPVIAVKPDGSWICPFCDTHNTAESKHCKNCGIEK